MSDRNYKLEEAVMEACDTLLQDRFNGPKSESVGTGLNQIPINALRAIGAIFKEGEFKYGKNNWKGGVHNRPYQEDRYEHALNHLFEFKEQFDEADFAGSAELIQLQRQMQQNLAKVAWFCVTQLHLLMLEHNIEREDYKQVQEAKAQLDAASQALKEQSKFKRARK